MIIAIDFDGTIAQYDGWKGEEHFGEPIIGAVAALQTLKRQGHTIVIHTCRKPTEALVAYLKAHQIPFDRVNVSPVDDRPQSIPHKLPADVYIDDKALCFKGDWPKMLKLLKGFKSWNVPTHEWTEDDKKMTDEKLDKKLDEAEKVLEGDAI